MRRGATEGFSKAAHQWQLVAPDPQYAVAAKVGAWPQDGIPLDTQLWATGLTGVIESVLAAAVLHSPPRPWLLD
jgi:hypothetical protein